MEMDEKYMQEALREARAAGAEDEVPIGAVVVCRGRVIARGHNITERLHDPTAHAEMIALTAATEALGGKYLDDCTLYVTVEPCPMCAAALCWAQLGRLVYGAPDPKGGAVRSLFQLLEDPRLNWRCQVVPGVLEEECAETLRQFFRERRARGSKT